MSMPPISAYDGKFLFQLNVLIDDGGKAVLCDFGLSRVKADATSHTVRANTGGIIGSRNWMAPEQLLGKSLKKPCDIYAFGMTLYEVSLDCIALQMLSLTQSFGRFSWMRFPWVTSTMLIFLS
jgi:serine/threonine protein kinase